VKICRLIIVLGLSAIASSALAEKHQPRLQQKSETPVYDQDYNLRYRAKDNKVYDQNYNLEYRIQDGKVYDRDYNLKYRTSPDSGKKDNK
jgi:hypothetical protein